MEFLNKLNGLDLSFASLADLLFVLIILVVFVITIILTFHWRRYGISKSVFFWTEAVYLTVSVALISVAFFSLQ